MDVTSSPYSKQSPWLLCRGVPQYIMGLSRLALHILNNIPGSCLIRVQRSTCTVWLWRILHIRNKTLAMLGCYRVRGGSDRGRMVKEPVEYIIGSAGMSFCSSLMRYK